MPGAPNRRPVRSENPPPSSGAPPFSPMRAAAFPTRSGRRRRHSPSVGTNGERQTDGGDFVRQSLYWKGA